MVTLPAIASTGEELYFSTILIMDTYEPANKAINDKKAMKMFFHRIQFRGPSPLSQLWTVSTMAGVRRPRLERKIAPQRLMKSSRSGKAAARATVGG
ncbi:jg1191 [Pararge aegeria aegeria]|uniref:Jg1191 protein n=1 Tax=Pararge aegeria aegeria TaxID=348720 RepID=A0A8S4QR37_9NEOP|nr:jg1191 [Pararge aegeria aegeria]